MLRKTPTRTTSATIEVLVDRATAPYARLLAPVALRRMREAVRVVLVQRATSAQPPEPKRGRPGTHTPQRPRRIS
jgi:hypothetical protein